MLQLSRAKPGNPASIYIGECVCVYPSKRIHVAISGPIGTKFGTHMQIHLEKVVGKIKICPVWPRGHMGGFRGSEIDKWGKSANRLDRLAPNLAHMRIHLGTNMG